MRGNIGKGTDEFRFFGDLFKLVGEFYIVESNEEYWDNLIKSSDNLLEKYKKCRFSGLARGFVLVLNVWLSDIKYKQVESGHWRITFEPDKGVKDG